MKFLFICVLFSFSAFSFDCSRKVENLKFSNLDWFEISKFSVRSKVTDVNGVLCLGFTQNKKLQKVHYFDDLNNIVLKDARDLFRGDVIFFPKSILPGFIRAITRSEDPMSLGIEKISNNKYKVNIKFVENMMIGLGRTRLRAIPVIMDYSRDYPIVTLDGNEFDDFYLKVSNTVTINFIATYFRGQKIKGYNSNYFKKTKRNRKP